MTEEKDTKVITVRLSEDIYEKFKTYAEKQGKSMNALLCQMIERALSGAEESLPGPSPEPGPMPQPSPAPIVEMLSLPGRVKKLEETDQAIIGYINGLNERVEEYHRQVNQLLGVVGVPMPHMPTPEEWIQKFPGVFGGRPGE